MSQFSTSHGTMGTCPDILKVSKVSNKSDLLKPGAILCYNQGLNGSHKNLWSVKILYQCN